jgi:hypothetical protein
MVITNSIFRAFLECPARALALYRPRMMEDATIVPEWDDKGSESMACGSLVDAIVTRGLVVSEDAKTSVSELSSWLKSSYDDGTKNAEWLLNKNGTFSTQAQTAIRAARRLLEDETFAELMRGKVKKQARLRFNLFDDVYWEGDIDLLCDEAERHHIIDLKSPASIDDQWITVKGKNEKVKWYDAWSYWFQLAGYAFGLDLAVGSTLNGVPCGKIEKPSLSKLGLVFTSRSKVPQIGYVPIANHWQLWERVVLGRSDGQSCSKAEAIANIARGLVEAPACGKCDYCASKSKVTITEPTEEPKIDDIFGLNF